MPIEYVHYETHTRIACDRCHCELHALGDPKRVYVSELSRYWLDVRTEDGVMAKADPDCTCRCHETARAFLRNPYELA